jgi:hypothetical protein
MTLGEAKKCFAIIYDKLLKKVSCFESQAKPAPEY